MHRVSVVLRDTDNVAGLAATMKVISQQNCQDAVEVIWLTEEKGSYHIQPAERIKVQSLSLGIGRLETSDALNQGCALATGDCVIFTDGHTMPLGDNWLVSAIAGIGQKLVAGVCAPVLPGPDANFSTRFGAEILTFPERWQKPRRIDRAPVRDFAPCNMAIRRQVWYQMPFPQMDSAWESAQLWARAVMGMGYDLLTDWNFAARCIGYGVCDAHIPETPPTKNYSRNGNGVARSR